MKTIKSSHDITLPPKESTDRTDLSDLYLTNQQLVQENQEARREHMDEIDEAQKNPLAVATFRRNDAIGLSAALAILVAIPFVAMPLMNIGGGQSFDVLAGVTSTFTVAIILLFYIRVLVSGYASFCRQADVRASSVLVSLLPFIVVTLAAYYGNPYKELGGIGIIVFSAAGFYWVLFTIYSAVHKRQVIK
jgi:hypothetical protein